MILESKSLIIFKKLANILGVVVILSNTLSVYGQIKKKSFELKGKLLGVDSGRIYLQYYINKKEKIVVDSSIIQGGIFSFSGDISEPTVAFITLVKGRAFDVNATNIFLEPSSMSISLEFNKFDEVILSGSNSQDEYENLRKSKSHLIEEYKNVSDQSSKETDENKIRSLNVSLDIIMDSLNKKDFSFFESHPRSYITAYLLQYHVKDLSPDSLTYFYNRLGDELQSNIVAKNISKKIVQKKIGSPGSIAKSFMGVDINGNYLVSKFIRDKYILLNFWASWCVPCRKDNPQLMELYKKYKEKRFVIIGVADNDGDTSAWKKAIQKDGIGIWNNVLRGLNKEAKLKELSNDMDIFEKFGVGELPVLILINPEGVIIARYEAGDDPLNRLSNKLKKIFY